MIYDVGDDEDIALMTTSHWQHLWFFTMADAPAVSFASASFHLSTLIIKYCFSIECWWWCRPPSPPPSSSPSWCRRFPSKEISEKMSLEDEEGAESSGACKKFIFLLSWSQILKLLRRVETKMMGGICVLLICVGVSVWPVLLCSFYGAVTGSYWV